MGVKVKERNGDWWIFINHQGKRKAKKIGKDKRLALDVAKKIEAKLALKALDLQEKKAVLTFGDYAKTWIAVTVPATCKKSTFRDYQGILTNHVLAVFGKFPVTEINRLMVKNFLMEKVNEGFAASTVIHIKNCIGGVLGLALDDEAIASNPAHKLGKIIRDRGLKISSDPLSREEISLLLDTFQKHYPEHYPLVLTLARTGIRFGEALALQWGDIDFNSRFIAIQRGMSRGRIETPKNGKTRRVDMSLQLTKTLKELQHERKLEAIKKGWGQVPDYVFINNKGLLLEATNWRHRVYKRALERAGLRHIRIHDLRHSFASLLIQAGESLAYIRDQLGHHSIKVTVDIYGHLVPGANKEAVDRLDDATGRNLYATKTKKELTISG